MRWAISSAPALIRYFALSNHRAWRVAEICNICDRLGIDRPVASQPHYNALNRMAEVEQTASRGLLRPWASCPTARSPAACCRANTP